MTALTKYYGYLLRAPVAVTLLCFTTSLWCLLLMVQPFIDKIVYDDLLNTYDSGLLAMIIMVVAALAALLSVGNVCTDVLTTHLRGKLISFIRGDISSEIMAYKLEDLRSMDIGDTVQRLIPEVETVGTTVSATVKAAVYGAQLIGLLGLTLYFGIPLFLICAASLAVYLAWHSLLRRSIGRRSSDFQNAQGEMYGFFFECIQNVKLVKLFNGYDRVTGHLDAKLRITRKMAIGSSIPRALLTLSYRILDIAVLSIAVYSTHRIASGNLTVGFHLTFTALLMRLGGPVNFLIDMGNQIQSGKVAAARIMDVVSGARESSGKLNFSRVHECIEFDGVDFHYPGGKSAISGATFRIDAGSMVAIVGPSGSGKSTLVQLLARLNEPTTGAIRIDGKTLPSYDLLSLRESIGVVSQDFFLFNDSLRNNIDPHERYPDAAVEEFMRLSGLESSRTPPGRGIGQGGWNLSGGERQRVAIARIIAKKPSILVMDEGTSNLDPRTESAIMEGLMAIRERNPGMILILVTHRTGQLEMMDKIFVVEGGQVSEQASLKKRSSRGHESALSLSASDAGIRS